MVHHVMLWLCTVHSYVFHHVFNQRDHHESYLVSIIFVCAHVEDGYIQIHTENVLPNEIGESVCI